MTTYYNDYPKELQDELRAIANAIVAPGKGILAADESTATCGKRFQVRFQNFLLNYIHEMKHFFRTLDVKTPKRTVVHTVNCSSPLTTLSLPTSQVSFCSTKPSTRRPLMELLSSKSSRRRESFPESRSTAVSLTWWLRKVRIFELRNCYGNLQ